MLLAVEIRNNESFQVGSQILSGASVANQNGNSSQVLLNMHLTSLATSQNELFSERMI